MYHPKYFELADTARNHAFESLGYPVEEQLKDLVGFTIASIDGATFSRPLFMGEEVTVFTEFRYKTARSCEVIHWIKLGNTEITDTEARFEGNVFKANYTLVFVSLAEVNEFPLNSINIKKMKAIPFNERAGKILGSSRRDT
jgi:acyl-CoA thioesterase FadM